MALTTLALDLKAGETVSINGPASIRLESKSGTSARLSIMADESVQIDRPRANPAAQQAAQGLNLNPGPAQERRPVFTQTGA